MSRNHGKGHECRSPNAAVAIGRKAMTPAQRQASAAQAAAGGQARKELREGRPTISRHRLQQGEREARAEGHEFERARAAAGFEFGVFVDGAFVFSSDVITMAEMRERSASGFLIRSGSDVRTSLSALSRTTCRSCVSPLMTCSRAAQIRAEHDQALRRSRAYADLNRPADPVLKSQADRRRLMSRWQGNRATASSASRISTRSAVPAGIEPCSLRRALGDADAIANLSRAVARSGRRSRAAKLRDDASGTRAGLAPSMHKLATRGSSGPRALAHDRDEGIARKQRPRRLDHPAAHDPALANSRQIGVKPLRSTGRAPALPSAATAGPRSTSADECDDHGDRRERPTLQAGAAMRTTQ